MNKKGFTLIELLAVIVILSSISLIVVSSITSSLERRDNDECEQQKKLAVNAAKIYFSLNEDNGNEVKISELKNGGYINEQSKTNKLDDDSYVKIENDDYVFYGECK